MNIRLIITLLKRELWENKISFLWVPVLVSALIMAIVIGVSVYTGAIVSENGVGISFTANEVPLEASIKLGGDRLVTVNPPLNQGPDWKNYNPKQHVESGPDVFDGMVNSTMYGNCVLLYLVFGIVVSGYALRCLFDDRKNLDILFWRSMPVSETLNVLVKLAMIVVVAPFIMLLLNLLIVFLSVILGLIFYGSFGVSPVVLLSSIADGNSWYIPFQIFYELEFAMLMLMPVLGFALLASALAKRSPFFLFASPAVLIFSDLALQKVWGLGLGIVNILGHYLDALVKTRSAFVLREPFIFNTSMIAPLLACLLAGGLMITAAIWLRNNRYEI